MFPPGTALAWSSRSGTCIPCSRARVRAGPALWMSPLEKCFYIYTLYFLCHAQGRSKSAGDDKKRQKTYNMRIPLRKYIFCHFIYLFKVAYRSFEHTDVVVTRYVFVEAASYTLGVTHLSEYAAVRGCDSLDSVH